MFKRTNLSSDAKWLVDEVVSALKAQGLLIITDMPLDEVQAKYKDPASGASMNVMKPDDLKSALLDLLSEHAKIESN